MSPTTPMVASIIPRTLLNSLSPLGLNFERTLSTIVEIKSHQITVPKPIERMPTIFFDDSLGSMKLKRANMAIKKNRIPMLERFIKNDETRFFQ